MKSLFLSEFQRLCYRKSTTLCFLSIPIILMATAKYYLGVNTKMDITSPQFTSFYNFPVAAIQEQLVLVFNMIVVLLIVLSVTQEVRNSSIRMVLIRRFRPIEVFISKFLVIVVIVFIYLITYFILSYIVGFIMFPKLDQVSVFYCSDQFNGVDLFIYSLKYYFVAFLTLIAIASLIFFIGGISKSVIIASGISVVTLLLLISYPILVQILFFNRIEAVKYQLLSITQIQYQGIAMMIGDKGLYGFHSLAVMFTYIIIFSIFNYFIYSKKDNLM